MAQPNSAAASRRKPRRRIMETAGYTQTSPLSRSLAEPRPEDTHDLVAQKTLEPMTQIDAGAWDPAAADAEQFRASSGSPRFRQSGRGFYKGVERAEARST